MARNHVETAIEAQCLRLINSRELEHTTTNPEKYWAFSESLRGRDFYESRIPQYSKEYLMMFEAQSLDAFYSGMKAVHGSEWRQGERAIIEAISDFIGSMALVTA